MTLNSLLTFLVLYIAYTIAVEMPPRISQPPTIIPEMQVADTLYFSDSGERKVDLPCRAIGSKPLRFEWTKNGQLLNISDPKYFNAEGEPRIVFVSEGTGTLLITQLEKEDEGIYQCRAINNYGVSLSKKLQLVKALIGIFLDAGKDARRYQVMPAEHLKVVCNPPKSNPPGKVKWLKYVKDETDTDIVDLDDRVAVDDDGNLYFANVRATDNNFKEKYSCQNSIMQLGVHIEGSFSYIEVGPGTTIAQFPAELVYYTTPDAMTGLKGKSVAFKCIFAGNPTPEIEWIRVGGDLVPNRMIQDNQELLIREIEYTDAGTYECRGKNSITTQTQTHRFTLEVHALPEWTAEPRPVNAGVEEKAVFECAAAGKPTPIVSWFVNGKPIDSLMPDSRRSLSEGQLIFRNLTRGDAQVIQCNASNIHGYLWKDVALSILAFKPEIKIPLTKVKVAEGQSVVLPCETEGKPNPIIYWKKGDVKLEGRRYRIHWKGNLTIDGVTTNDGGHYTCFTENRYGKTNATGELWVRRRTRIKDPPYPATQTIKFGNQLTFTCGATTDPNELDQLVISWLKDGEPVNLNDPRISKKPDSSLFITGLNSSDSGRYTCVASNGLDSDSKSAEVKIIAPPDPPVKVSFKSCLSRSALVTWEPGKDNFSPITKYHIEYNHSYAPTVWTRAAVAEDPQLTEATVMLSPHANYTFRVIAVNDLGESQPSTISTPCQSNPAKPDKHPSNVHTDRSKPGVLIIKWDRMPEIEHNGDNFKYVLVIKKDGKTNRTEISDWKENQKEIDTGQIYTPYEIYVEAYNKEGTYERPAVVHFGYTGEDKPLVVPGNFEQVPNTTLTAKSGQFQWDPVDSSPEKMRGEFRGYRIRFWKTDDPENTRKVIEIKQSPPEDERIRRDNRVKRATKKERWTVKNLYPYSNVSMDVVAVNTFYESNASNVIIIETPEGEPGPVGNPRVLFRGAHHFLLEWSKPMEPNGILTGYEIGYQEVESLKIGKYQVAETFDDPERTRAYVGGLSQNREYRIHVRALTKAGRGESYYIDAKTASPGTLLQPTMTVAEIGEDFVNVSWTVKKDEDKPAGSVHFVKYRKLGESSWIESDHERIYNWVNVSGLSRATRYEMIVVASNGKVEQSSDKHEVLTAGGAIPVEPVTSIAQASWFIGMMVAIAVLILFLIIVCFIKRSRGEKYHVQEKERLRGTDPESANNKDHFNEYAKNGEKEPLAAGSPDSFDADTEKVGGGSETDSMAEYGDVDPSKFNEDGSFIGQYGESKPISEPNAPSAMSTFV